MLTIEIPKSNRRKSEEDALASFSLSEIKEKGECVYFHYGVGWGNNWPHCWAKNTGSDAKDRHQISELAHDWKLERMGGVDRAATRMAIYEIKFGESRIPPRAAVNEAVELAKHYGSEESGRFVNGILGSLVRGLPE